MSDFKPRPGTFLPFLNYSKENQSARPSPLTLLEILAAQPACSLLLFDLQIRSGMQPLPYGESLKRLRNAGYIVFAGEVPDQTVQLTDSGVQASRLAQPL
jgi:hypothetical protein